MRSAMNWIKLFVKLLFVMLVMLSCAAVIEFGLRTFYYNGNEDNYAGWNESKPKAFRNEANFSDILKSLDGTCQFPAMAHRNGTSIFTSDFSCGGVTYMNHKRLTLPIVSEWNKTIHIFGGSTVMGVGSVDAFTIPSIIQMELLNDQIRVLNYGVSSFVVRQQNDALKAFKGDIRKDDVVIYYDGGNDFWNGVMLGNFDGDMVGYNQKNKYQLYIFILRNWLSKNSKTYRLLSDLKHNRKEQPDVCSVDSKIAAQRISQAANHFSNKINEAREISETLGAEFFHFYQPTLFDSNVLTPYEEKIVSQNPCFSVAMPFKKVFNNIFLDVAKNSVDLSNILAGEDLFFDYIHVSSQANKLVSEIIVENIKENKPMN